MAGESPRPGKQALLEQLRADGLTAMFGNPGTVEQGLLDLLVEHPEFEYYLALQECTAVGMADGYARATGQAALVQLHAGVGLGNGIGMLYQAMRGHSPLVVLAGEAGVRYEAMDAQMAADLVAMAEPVTKYAARVTHPDSLLRTVRRAVKIALTPPRGPVFVAVPMDVLDAPNTEPVVPTSVPSRVAVPPEELLDRAARLLREAASPLILMGDGVSVSGAQAELAAVAEALGAPVWGLDDSEVNMDATHPLYRGQMGHMFGEQSRARVAAADAVLIVGAYTFPEVFPVLANPFRPDAAIVHVDLDEWEVAKNFPVTLGLVADPKPTLAALAARLPGRAPAGQAAAWSAPAVTDESPLIESFAAELREQAGPGLVLFDEALTVSPGLRAQLPPRDPGSYFQTRGGSLGVGIPGAMGIKLARPQAPVWAFTGDGGSMYTVQALWTAARHRIAAKFVICNNRRYRLLDLNLEQYRLERAIPAHPLPDGFDLSRPEIDFAGLARALGVEAERVGTAQEVKAAVARALAHPGPYLIDLAVG